MPITNSTRVIHNLRSLAQYTKWLLSPSATHHRGQYNTIWPQYNTIHAISIPQSISFHRTHPPYQACSRREQTMPDWASTICYRYTRTIPSHPIQFHPIIPHSLPQKSHSLPKTLTFERRRKEGRKVALCRSGTGTQLESHSLYYTPYCTLPYVCIS